MKKNIIALTLFSSLFSLTAHAHPSFLGNNFFTGASGTGLVSSYVEGTSAYLEFNPGHGCGHDVVMPPVMSQTVIFPNQVTEFVDIAGDGTPTKNGYKLVDHLYTTDGTNNYGANVLMAIRAQTTGDFKQVKTIVGSLDIPFYNHGTKSSDINAVHWINAVDGGMDGNYEFALLGVRGSLPKIKSTSCITKINVYTPAVMYCKNMKGLSNNNAWLLAPVNGTPFNMKEHLAQWAGDPHGNTATFAAKFTIVRDTTNNPVQGGCVGPSTVNVYPDEADIKNAMLPSLNRGVKIHMAH